MDLIFTCHPKKTEVFDQPVGIKSKPPVLKQEAVFSCPRAYYLGEGTAPHLVATSFQEVVENDTVSPECPFLQTKQPHLLLLLLTRLTFQNFH